MNWNDKKKIRIAILDLYEGFANQGMRCIREILNQFGEANDLEVEWDEFEVRINEELPGMDYDVYISSGGPGSPLESEGSSWENKYFNWFRDIESWNKDEKRLNKKYVFFICHSFQLISRHYNIANVCKRKSTSFGVFPIHLMDDGREEPVFEGMNDPFYAVDSRDYQVIEPNYRVIREMDATILAIEKERMHVPLERAIMAIRFNEYFIGTQFHPEADPVGMSLHLQTEEKKKTVIDSYGEEKWQSMIDQLNDPEKICWTYAHILPNFLNMAVRSKERVAA